MKNVPIHELDKEDYLVIEKIESGKRINFKEAHCHSFYEILYFTSINAGDIHFIDFVEYPISLDHIYIIHPFQIHEMKLKTQTGYSFALTREYMHSLHLWPESYFDYMMPNDLSFEKHELKCIVKILDLILYEHQNKHRRELLDIYAKTLLTQLILTFKKDSNENYKIDKRVLQLMDLIDKNFVEQRNTDFYARQLYLSGKRLNELTKKALGTTIKQLISERLLLEAKRLISYGDRTFKEIAFELGFNDSSYFSRFFKDQSGFSPEQFKSFLR